MRRRLLLALLCLTPACAADQTASPGPTTIPDQNDIRSVPTEPGDPLDRGAERLRAAAEATTAAGTARTTYVATLTSIPGRSEPISLTGSGAVDFASGRMQSTLDLSDALTAPASGGAAEGGPEPSWETISADGLVYLRAPMLLDLLGVETPWVRVDPSSELLAAAGGFAPLGRLAGNDSGAALALLAGLEEGSVTDLGSEDVAGTATTHFRGTVDLLATVDSVGGPPPDAEGADAERQALERFVDGLGARQLAVDAFLDGDDRVRRLVYEHELAPEAGGGTQRVELEYTALGEAVTITVPPVDQVTDLEQAFRRG